MPQSEESWEADNSSLGSALVHQVLSAQTVDDKNMVLCAGIYNHFISKYGTNRKGNKSGILRKSGVRRHNRAFKKLTQDKNREGGS